MSRRRVPSEKAPTSGRFGPKLDVGRLLAVCCGVLALGCFAGCIEERVIYDSWGDLKSMSDEGMAEAAKEAQKEKERTGAGSFSILMLNFDGENHERRAKLMAERLNKEFKLEAVWVRTSDTRSSLMYGRYPDPNTFNAQQDLSRLREFRLDGVTLFERSQITVLSATGLSEADQLDIRNCLGDLSLQVAVFDKEMGAQFQKAAELMALGLRQQGVEAFYHHSPDNSISIVTVGTFLWGDAIPLGDGEYEYSAEVLALRSKFPNVIDNGKLDPRRASLLVRVPK